MNSQYYMPSLYTKCYREKLGNSSLHNEEKPGIYSEIIRYIQVYISLILF